LEGENVKKKDFDLEKIELEKAKTLGMTLEVWRSLMGKGISVTKSSVCCV